MARFSRDELNQIEEGFAGMPGYRDTYGEPKIIGRGYHFYIHKAMVDRKWVYTVETVVYHWRNRRHFPVDQTLSGYQECETLDGAIEMIRGLHKAAIERRTAVAV